MYVIYVCLVLSAHSPAHGPDHSSAYNPNHGLAHDPARVLWSLVLYANLSGPIFNFLNIYEKLYPFTIEIIILENFSNYSFEFGRMVRCHEDFHASYCDWWNIEVHFTKINGWWTFSAGCLCRDFDVGRIFCLFISLSIILKNPMDFACNLFRNSVFKCQ